MERERPEYLPPIPRSRWEFPWLGMWAVLLLGMAGAGIWLHLRTGDAWNARFNRPETASNETPSNTAHNKAFMAELRERRERAEAEIKMAQAMDDEIAIQNAEAARLRNATDHDKLRCINGVAFRRIPGGWENVPDAPCP
ncbi:MULTISPECIES: hypothetical protein [Stenotrophomonas]|uniref:hypothetical protein n=1 Tax=Stenotrophomonas TaxID=40323 RepID=UPI000B660F6A|nr:MULTISPECIES: hypothetical protein [Stenotrophomonas]SMR68819.1 hypothetical protein SAMN04487863_0009 [Stenotrophomonas sp. yr243]SNT59296.1 hypothetical protein SAMN05518671_3905 [Stenotrophomonas lactitubi]